MTRIQDRFFALDQNMETLSETMIASLDAPALLLIGNFWMSRLLPLLLPLVVWRRCAVVAVVNVVVVVREEASFPCFSWEEEAFALLALLKVLASLVHYSKMAVASFESLAS
jgi:hypothetical protein